MRVGRGARYTDGDEPAARPRGREEPAIPISERTYERVAPEKPDGKWELHCGSLRSKPGMTTQHNDIGRMLGFRLQQQLPLDQYRVATDTARARFSPTRTHMPAVDELFAL